MDTSFVLRTMMQRGLLNPARPDRLLQQFSELRAWGYGLAGALRSGTARRPHRLAVVDGQRALTYEVLTQRSLRLADGLRAAYGVGPGDPVGVLCQNSVPMVETMAAIALIGATPVLVNTGLGPEMLAAVLHDQKIRVLVHDDDLLELVAAASPSGIRRISADGDPRRPIPTLSGLVSVGQPREAGPPERPSTIVVLTSGTRGAPRGARRPTAPGMHPLTATLARIPLRTGERMFIAAPLFHTWGLSMLQVCFALGGTAVLRRRFEPAGAYRALHQHRCTSMIAVPVMLQRLLEVPPVPGVRVVASSGSALPGGLASRFMDGYGDVLYNLYGSTEVSAVSIATPDELHRAPSCAGRPPRGTRVAILGPNGEPLRRGLIGRIYVGNDLLFEGYTDGATCESHDGMYFTGDLGHLASDGLLFVDGRADDMVVSGGENVYPSTVEDVLAELPQVREVAVAGVPDAEYGQRLAAWIVLHEGERLDRDAAREYVRHRLARFSVPRDVHFLGWLPRNATGKVLTRRLRGDTSPDGGRWSFGSPTTDPGYA